MINNGPDIYVDILFTYYVGSCICNVIGDEMGVENKQQCNGL